MWAISFRFGLSTDGTPEPSSAICGGGFGGWINFVRRYAERVSPRLVPKSANIRLAKANPWTPHFGGWL
jgi:hypothetical protein